MPGYNESVPMTDQSLPGKQIDGRAGAPGSPPSPPRVRRSSRATSGAGYAGTLAVAALKASKVLFMKFDSAGKLVDVRIPAELKKYGRLRAVTALPNGSLLITTDNGTDDAVLRVRPVTG